MTAKSGSNDNHPDAAGNEHESGGELKPSVSRRTKPTRKRKPVQRTSPMSEKQFDQIRGIPTDADIAQQLGQLSPADRKTFKAIQRLLESHLGSTAAARLWLLTPEADSTITPAQAIREGRGKQVLDVLKAQWGRNPVHA